MIYERVEEACDYLLEKAKEYHIDIKWNIFRLLPHRVVVMNTDV
ncbi:hypothetical protein [Limosilactobacillus portuensis]|jgi:hypothetical protein|nr:hypothetical protein [Limosilactobacillus portuensis]DAZ56381.1 MAG TPA: hypothetical protein [Caudoviricetes sp.]